MTARLAPGFYTDVSAEDYHADPCIDISLSRSIAWELLESCPRKAWHRHPRLNPQWSAEEPDNEMLLGSACHKILLGKGADIAVVEAKDWRTKEAQTQKAAAFAHGKIPLTRPQCDRALEMLGVASKRMMTIDLGVPELCVVASDPTGATLRSLIDWYGNKLPNGLEIWDYKTTKGSANPIFAMFAEKERAFQFAFIERCVVLNKPELAGRIKFRNLVQEQDEPYLCAVIEPDQAAMTVARKMVAAAIGIWARCIKTNTWPAYPANIIPIGLSVSAEKSWLDRELADQTVNEVLAADTFLAKVMRDEQP